MDLKDEIDEDEEPAQPSRKAPLARIRANLAAKAKEEEAPDESDATMEIPRARSDDDGDTESDGEVADELEEESGDQEMDQEMSESEPRSG